MGTNDRGFEVEIGIDASMDTLKFYGAYRTMLRQIKNNYTFAQIVCATLLMGYRKDGQNLAYDRFMREDTRYNGAIRLAVKEESCILADLALLGERYETLDYCHPTRKGHSTMARLWLECLESII